MKIRFLKLCSAFLLLLAGCASGKISGFVYGSYDVNPAGRLKIPNNPLWIARYQLLINILIKKYN